MGRNGNARRTIRRGWALRSAGKQRGPEHTRGIPELVSDNRREELVVENEPPHALHPLRVQEIEVGDPTPEHDRSRIEDVDERREPPPQRFEHLIEGTRGVRVVRSPRGDFREPRVAPGPPEIVALHGGTARAQLQATGLPAVPRPPLRPPPAGAASGSFARRAAISGSRAWRPVLRR